MNMIKTAFLLFVIALTASCVEEVGAQQNKSSSKKLTNIEAQIRTKYRNIEVVSVEETPISGLYQLNTSSSILYVSADGRYVIEGDLFDQDKQFNITQSKLNAVRKNRLDKLGDKNLLVYKAKGVEKQVINVFTDTSCGYCRKLHQDIPALNADGITVRYLLFPRMGPQSPSSALMQSVWCSPNPQQAMTKAKSNGRVTPARCANPIAEHMRIGQEFGLRGTPMIITQTGEVLPGYYP